MKGTHVSLKAHSFTSGFIYDGKITFARDEKHDN